MTPEEFIAEAKSRGYPKDEVRAKYESLIAKGAFDLVIDNEGGTTTTITPGVMSQMKAMGFEDEGSAIAALQSRPDNQITPEEQAEMDVDLVDGLVQSTVRSVIEAPAGAYGMIETGASMATGMAGALVGAVVGGADALTASMKGDRNAGQAYMDQFNKYSELMTYEPRTEYGQYTLGKVQDAFHWVSGHIDDAADAAYESARSSDNPVIRDAAEEIGTSVKVVGEGVILASPFLGPKGIRKATDILSKRKPYEKPAPLPGAEIAAPKEVKPTGSGTQDLSPNILTKEEYIEAAKADLPPKTPKAQVEAAVAKAEKNYDTYVNEAKRYESERLKQAIDEVVNGSITRRDVPLPIRNISYEQLLETPGSELGRKSVRQPQDLNYPEAAMEGGKSIPQEKIVGVRERTNKAYEEAERRAIEDQVNQEHAMWEERNAILSEERIRGLLEQNNIKDPLWDSKEMGRKHWGRQGGAVTPGVYLEGLIKAGKKYNEIMDIMVRDFGYHWKSILPLVYEEVARKAQAAQEPPKTVAEGVSKAIHGESTFGSKIQNLMQERFKPGSMMSSFIEVFAGKSITMLRKRAETNPIFKEIVNLIEKPEKSHNKVVADDMTTSYMKAAGHFLQRISGAMELSGDMWFTGVRETVRGKLSKKLNDEVVALLRSRKELTGKGKAGAIAGEIRKVLNDVHRYASEAGLDVEYLKGYFPRMFEINKIRKNKELRAGFEDLLRRYGMKNAEIDSLIEKLIMDDGVLSMDINRSGRQLVMQDAQYKLPRRAVNVEMQRKLRHIPDSELAPYLKNDAYSVLVKYIEDTVARSEFTRRFGKDEKVLNNMVKKAIEYGHETGNPITRLELIRLYDLVDAVQRNGKKIMTPGVRKLNNLAVTSGNIITLPLAATSALAEMALPLHGGGLKAYVKAWPKTLRYEVKQLARKLYRGVPKDIAHMTAESVFKASDLAATERLNALYNGEVNGINTAFFKANLLSGVTKFNQVLAQETFINLLVDLGKKASKEGRWTSKLPWKRAEHARITQFMNRMGVDVTQLKGWYERGALREDPWFQSQGRTGALNFIHEYVMTSRAAVRPMWHSIPHLAVLSHLKGFPTMFGNTVLKRWYQDTIGELAEGNLWSGSRNAAYVVATGSLAMLFAHLGAQLKDYLRYEGEDNPYIETQEDELFRAANMAGLLPPGGWSTIATGMMAKEKFGGDPVLSMEGPTATNVSRIMSGLAHMNKSSRQLARTLASITPGATANAELKDAYTEYYEEWLDNIAGR